MRRQKTGKNREKIVDSFILTPEEMESLRKAVDAIEAAKEKHGLSYNGILDLLKERRIPVTIFNKKLSSLESISRYLKDELDLNYHQIAVLLGRDERNIWHSYNNSLKKHPEKLVAGPTQFFIPLSIFAEKKFSILESIVVHLRHEYNLSYSQISRIVQRDERTVWTACSRARKKQEAQDKNKGKDES